MPHYSLLRVNGDPSSRYENLYYDTPDFAIYYRHHNGGAGRYKIRYRSYLESGIGFLEIKRKTNKGLIVKDRLQLEKAPVDGWDPQSTDFIKRITDASTQTLHQALRVNYSRMTFVDKALSERVTIDTGIAFSNGSSAFYAENLVIAEVKQGAKAKSAVLTALKELEIKPGALGKYCMGIAYIYPSVRKNNFRQRLNLINKIVHDNAVNPAAGH